MAIFKLLCPGCRDLHHSREYSVAIEEKGVEGVGWLPRVTECIRGLNPRPGTDNKISAQDRFCGLIVDQPAGAVSA